MALVATPAIVLHAFRYSETSKIVRLATRELGVQSAIAKGAYRKKSPFGGGLEFLSDGIAQLYHREQRDLQTLSAFDLSKVRTSLASELSRFAAGSALAEVMLRMAPAAPLPAAYDSLRGYLDLLGDAPSAAVDAVALRALWRLVGVLGFAPQLDACVRDDTPVPPNGRHPVAFSVAQGGVLCPACSTKEDAHVFRMPAGDHRDLAALAGDEGELPLFGRRHAAAHRRLLGQWIRYHVGENRPFPALDWWEQRPWARAS